MTAYRRNLVADGTYFFTVNLADRRLSLLTDNIELLRVALRYIRHRHPFTIDVIVVSPDHLHALRTLPPGDSDFATRWRLIQTTFSRGLRATERVSASRSRKRERGVWQRRFWEHTDSGFGERYGFRSAQPILRPTWRYRQGFGGGGFRTSISILQSRTSPVIAFSRNAMAVPLANR